MVTVFLTQTCQKGSKYNIATYASHMALFKIGATFFEYTDCSVVIFGHVCYVNLKL